MCCMRNLGMYVKPLWKICSLINTKLRWMEWDGELPQVIYNYYYHYDSYCYYHYIYYSFLNDDLWVWLYCFIDVMYIYIFVMCRFFFKGVSLRTVCELEDASVENMLKLFSRIHFTLLYFLLYSNVRSAHPWELRYQNFPGLHP